MPPSDRKNARGSESAGVRLFLAEAQPGLRCQKNHRWSGLIKGAEAALNSTLPAAAA